MFLAALFIVAQNWIEPTCISAGHGSNCVIAILYILLVCIVLWLFILFHCKKEMKYWYTQYHG